ncbi:MAG: gliding motility-associated C-terminal domain-containing protein [Flavobacteriales bacterium]|nr:gliding motility-associated C-terminal domain-containing protein [Flavobacteriales bacterium]
MLFRLIQFAFIYAISCLFIFSQTPTNCFEIESILVDACVPGSPCTSAASPSCSCEGKNEMVRFRVGPSNLNLSTLTVNWPNNPWLGLCQNATTASHVAAMNATVLNCGLFVEPVGGILPAGREVLFITSTDFCVSAHSFANLSDTVIVIFQCAGNWQGHFANYGTGLRTLSMSFGAGCTDQVTYDRAQLLNQSLVPGPGDGALVNFAWDGTATYGNNGCNAPLTPQVVNAGADVNACPGDVLTFTASVQGSFSSYQWSGGAGTWTNANQLTATYQVGAGESGTIPITFTATNCNGNVTDQLFIQVTSNPQVSISPAGPINLCAGNNVNLTASGIGSFVWNTGSTTSTITVNSPGTYTVTASNACGSSTAQVVVQNAGSAPVATISPSSPIQLCQGNQVTLTASGGTSYTWNTGETTASIQVNSAGNYTVTVSNACGSSTASVSVSVTPLPNVSITPISPVNICSGQTVSLTASGTGNYQWNTGETTSTISVSNSGIYSVVSSNICGSDTAVVQVINNGTPPNLSIQPGNTVQLCQGQSVQITVNGADNYLWSTGQTSASVSFSSQGNYSVIGTNSCGSDTAYINIQVNDIPQISYNGNDTVLICSGQNTVLQVSANSPLTWNTGNTGSSLSVTQPGLYYVYTSNACGADTVFIQVQTSSVSANFTVNPMGGTVPLVVNTINNSTNTNSYTWNMGDGATYNTFQPSHVFTLPGVYSITLIGYNSIGCSDTAWVTITVDSCNSQIFIPNTFTPNNDGINDFFDVKGTCIDSGIIYIYNRWGFEIYKSAISNQIFWDGRTNTGSEAVQGVYVYLIELKDFNGTNQTFRGTLHLFK